MWSSINIGVGDSNIYSCLHLPASSTCPSNLTITSLLMLSRCPVSCAQHGNSTTRRWGSRLDAMVSSFFFFSSQKQPEFCSTISCCVITNREVTTITQSKIKVLSSVLDFWKRIPRWGYYCEWQSTTTKSCTASTVISWHRFRPLQN